MVDVNCGYHADVGTALRVGRQLEALDIAWYEEPLSPEHVDGYQALAAALDIPVAAGEASLRATISVISWCAGRRHRPTECVPHRRAERRVRKIAALSSAFHIPYAPIRAAAQPWPWR